MEEIQLSNFQKNCPTICIGINDYEDRTIIDLKKARNDAKELGKVLKEYGQFDRVYVMTDDLNPNFFFIYNSSRMSSA